MFNSIEESPLYQIANPKSIVFFGASNSITAMGTNLLMSLQAAGFEGSIYPVHLKEQMVLDLKAYRSVLDLPEIPDLAVIVLPLKSSTRHLKNAAEKVSGRSLSFPVVSGRSEAVGLPSRRI